MEYIADDQWANSAGIGPAGQAFVQRWLELFHRLTIDTYRVRHLNLRLAFEELTAVIADVSDIGTDPVNVREVAAEALRLLQEDPLAERLLPHRERYYHSLLHPLIDNRSVHPGLAVLTDQIREALNQRYRGTLLSALRDAITNGHIEQTVSLTSLLATDLIGEGYDLRHLYWRGQYFVKTPTRQFAEKLDGLLERFSRRRTTERYLVIFRLEANTIRAAERIPADVGGIQFTDAVPEATTPFSRVALLRGECCPTN